MEIINGGVTAAKGFLAAGAEANVKYKNRKDMAKKRKSQMQIPSQNVLQMSV